MTNHYVSRGGGEPEGPYAVDLIRASRGEGRWPADALVSDGADWVPIDDFLGRGARAKRLDRSLTALRDSEAQVRRSTSKTYLRYVALAAIAGGLGWGVDFYFFREDVAEIDRAREEAAGEALSIELRQALLADREVFAAPEELLGGPLPPSATPRPLPPPLAARLRTGTDEPPAEITSSPAFRMIPHLADREVLYVSNADEYRILVPIGADAAAGHVVGDPASGSAWTIRVGAGGITWGDVREARP